MDDATMLTNAIYGESASEDYDTMVMVGSSALERLDAGRMKEFGSTLEEVLNKGYYAVSNPNVPYKQALEQKFPDELSETKYKQAMAIASGLLRGTIERHPAQFYLTPKELKKTKMNMKLLKDTGTVGKYHTFRYK